MMGVVIDDTSVHEIAKWRREGHGVWHFVFVVEGYDEQFVMRAPGKLSEGFAQELTRQKLTKALKVKRKHVIHQQTAKES
jgi:hypothetical protein